MALGLLMLPLSAGSPVGRALKLAELLLGIVDTAAATNTAEAGSTVSMAWTAALQALGVLVEAERGAARVAVAALLRALVVRRLTASLDVVHREIAEHEAGGFGAFGGAFTPPVAQCMRISPAPWHATRGPSGSWGWRCQTARSHATAHPRGHCRSLAAPAQTAE